MELKKSAKAITGLIIIWAVLSFVINISRFVDYPGYLIGIISGILLLIFSIYIGTKIAGENGTIKEAGILSGFSAIIIASIYFMFDIILYTRAEVLNLTQPTNPAYSLIYGSLSVILAVILSIIGFYLGKSKKKIR